MESASVTFFRSSLVTHASHTIKIETFGLYSMAAAAFIGGALFILQQFAGINGVLYFSSLTFQDVGITSSASASVLVGITNFAGLDMKSMFIGGNIT